jgi:hypothetical protein
MSQRPRATAWRRPAAGRNYIFCTLHCQGVTGSSVLATPVFFVCFFTVRCCATLHCSKVCLARACTSRRGCAGDGGCICVGAVRDGVCACSTTVSDSLSCTRCRLPAIDHVYLSVTVPYETAATADPFSLCHHIVPSCQKVCQPYSPRSASQAWVIIKETSCRGTWRWIAEQSASEACAAIILLCHNSETNSFSAWCSARSDCTGYTRVA